MIINKITFDDILPIWKDKLWPGRESEIKPTNGIKFMGGFDKEIENNTPTFFGAFINDELVGVNSGFGTGIYSYRSRGLYVEPEHRKQKIAQSLLLAVKDQLYLRSRQKLRYT